MFIFKKILAISGVTCYVTVCDLFIEELTGSVTMKGIICYYSGSGNTKLAIQYIKEKIIHVDFELHDIVKKGMPDLDPYDIVGFATFTDFGGVPQYFHTFFDNLNPQNSKYAFVFNTFGFISGGTLKSFAALAESKGFSVISGYSLHTPESYPPMRVRNKAFDNAPNPNEYESFKVFISSLNDNLKNVKTGKGAKIEKINVGMVGSLFPAFPRTKAKKEFGKQQVNTSLCSQCGTCEEGCPYQAIQLSPHPVFDHDKCYGCWSCYNHCPEKAIHSKKYQGQGQYPRPSEELMEKFRIN